MAKSKPPQNNMMRQVQKMQERHGRRAGRARRDEGRGQRRRRHGEGDGHRDGDLVVDHDRARASSTPTTSRCSRTSWSRRCTTRTAPRRRCSPRSMGGAHRRARPRRASASADASDSGSRRGVALRRSGPALIDELGRLPGIGPKSAQRIAFHILRIAPEDAAPARRRDRRGQGAGLVVPAVLQHRRGRAVPVLPRRPARPHACSAWSRSRATSSRSSAPASSAARYHVLQGAISPIEGIGPEQLRIKELLARIDDDGVDEVILATNPNIEGEATAMYLARLLAARTCASRASRAACRSAATSSTPTRSRSAARSKAAATSTPDPHTRTDSQAPACANSAPRLAAPALRSARRFASVDVGEGLADDGADLLGLGEERRRGPTSESITSTPRRSGMSSASSCWSRSG